MANHVPRPANLGASVLIRESWYNKRKDVYRHEREQKSLPAAVRAITTHSFRRDVTIDPKSHRSAMTTTLICHFATPIRTPSSKFYPPSLPKARPLRKAPATADRSRRTSELWESTNLGRCWPNAGPLNPAQAHCGRINTVRGAQLVRSVERLGRDWRSTAPASGRGAAGALRSSGMGLGRSGLGRWSPYQLGSGGLVKIRFQRCAPSKEPPVRLILIWSSICHKLRNYRHAKPADRGSFSSASANTLS